jgi:hypothetical protein
MTTIDIGFFAKSAVRDSNLDHNDYGYYSGWNPDIQLGQQYMLGAAEAKELTYEINKKGWFQDPMLPGAPPTDMRGAILRELQKISTPEAAREMPKGSIRLTRIAAQTLNAYAQELGVHDVKFTAHNTRPSHPVG